MKIGSVLCIALLVLLLSPPVFADDVKAYIQNLLNENYTIREQAAEALGRLNDTRAIDPLIQTLTDRISDVRYSAIIALGEIGDLRAVDPLVQALKREKDDMNKCAIAKTLGKIGDLRAIDPLIRELENGNFGFGCTGFAGPSSVIEALGEIGDPRAVDPLLRILLSTDNFDGRLDRINVKSTAAQALEKIGKKGNRLAVDALIKALSIGSENRHWVHNRVALADALGNIGDPRAVDVLITVYENKMEDYEVRDAAGKALKKLPTL